MTDTSICEGAGSAEVALRPANEPVNSRKHSYGQGFIAAALLLALLVVSLQWLSGAYGAEFSDDDSSHYLSGLMVHDYLVAHFGASPIAFLKSYYSHYPLIGIGHWGPLYYVVEAVWMMLFSPSRASVLALSATMTIATALLLYQFVTRRFGILAGVTGALLFACSPIVREGSSELMLDVPIAFLCLLSLVVYVRYLESGRMRHAFAFGFIAASAMLIKGNGACLALLPPLAVLVTRRFDLLAKPSFWLPLPVATAIVAPWYIVSYGQAAAGFRYGWGLSYLATASSANLEILVRAEGPLVLLAAIGLVAALARPQRTASTQAVAAAGALFISVWSFQAVVPAAIQDRYLAPLLPPFFILAWPGFEWSCKQISQRFPHAPQNLRSRWMQWAIGAIILAISVVPGTIAIERRPHLGIIEAAQQVWSHRFAANPSMLIATSAREEGAAIAELAMADPHRPSLFVVRGSRLFGGGGYNNRDYSPKFKSPAETMAAIDQFAIPLVLIHADTSQKHWAHLDQLAGAQRLFADRWTLLYQGSGLEGGVRLYRIRANDTKRGNLAALTVLNAPKALSQ
jgi:hypothetical protein